VAEIINCIECNQQLSSDAKWCPHCRTEYPKGLTCRVCGKLGKNSQGVSTEGGTYGGVFFWVDSICYEGIKRELESFSHACPVCNNVEHARVTVGHNGMLNPYLPTPCRKCGHPSEISSSNWVRCTNCNLPLVRAEGVERKSKRTSEYYHKICALKLKGNNSGTGGCLTILVIVMLITLFSIISVRNLTTACTRPATRIISSSFNRSGGRVMPGVRRFFYVRRD
jgi:ribosomal protein L40E